MRGDGAHRPHGRADGEDMWFLPDWKGAAASPNTCIVSHWPRCEESSDTHCAGASAADWMQMRSDRDAGCQHGRYGRAVAAYLLREVERSQPAAHRIGAFFDDDVVGGSRHEVRGV